MYKIENHPILDLPKEEFVEFQFEGRTVRGQKGKTIAAALHQAGLIVHSHSTSGRNRSLECGIGKCGACEMLVDGQVRRISDFGRLSELPGQGSVFYAFIGDTTDE